MTDTFETEALLVRSVDYRDHDRIVTLLTADLGKVGAVAYGARRSKRRFAGSLQPFQGIRLLLRQRPGRDLYELKEAEVLETYPEIIKDPSRYAVATWSLELLRELSPEADGDGRAYHWATQVLRRLESDGASAWLVLAFVLQALRDAGVEPSFDRCAACGRPAPEGKSGYFDSQRGLICTSCGGSGPLLSGRVRAAVLAARRWASPPPSVDHGDLARIALLLCNSAHHHVGKELRSWSLLGRLLRSMTDRDAATS